MAPRQGGADNVPRCGDWNSMRGSWRRFHILWPAKGHAADDAVDEGLVPDKGTRGRGERSKRREAEST